MAYLTENRLSVTRVAPLYLYALNECSKPSLPRNFSIAPFEVDENVDMLW